MSSISASDDDCRFRGLRLHGARRIDGVQLKSLVYNPLVVLVRACSGHRLESSNIVVFADFRFRLAFDTSAMDIKFSQVFANLTRILMRQVNFLYIAHLLFTISNLHPLTANQRYDFQKHSLATAIETAWPSIAGQARFI